MEIKLTQEELIVALPLFAALDAAKQAYVQGIEIAKTVLVQQMTARRPTNESIDDARAGSAEPAPTPAAYDAAAGGSTPSGRTNGHA